MTELLFIHLLDSSFIISVVCLGSWLLSLHLLGLLLSLSGKLYVEKNQRQVTFPASLLLSWDIAFPPRSSTWYFCIIKAPWVLWIMCFVIQINLIIVSCRQNFISKQSILQTRKRVLSLKSVETWKQKMTQSILNGGNLKWRASLYAIDTLLKISVIPPFERTGIASINCVITLLIFSGQWVLTDN